MREEEKTEEKQKYTQFSFIYPAPAANRKLLRARTDEFEHFTEPHAALVWLDIAPTLSLSLSCSVLDACFLATDKTRM